jgi:hypothetical protein
MIFRLRLTGMRSELRLAENKGNWSATHPGLVAKITSVCMSWLYTLDLQDKFTFY